MPAHSYPRERIAARLRSCRIQNAVRLIWHRHLHSPLGCQPNYSRFCDGTFAVLYAASHFAAAFLETVVRDRFARSPRRSIGTWQIVDRAWVTLSTKPDLEVNLLDLRDSGCIELGAPTDAVHARNPAAGQALARSIYHEHPDVDGFLYASRFAGTDNFAIFDRALDKLLADASGELITHANLPELLERHEIQLLEK